MMDNSKRDKILRRWAALQNERSSWIEHWREISENISPRSGRWLIGDRNKGRKRHNKIYDSTATRANRTLAAGLMAGMTSPARPWFRLTTSIPELDESANVKKWLSDVSRLMSMIFAKSNTYRALHTGYEELGAFGSWGNIIMPNYKRVIHNHALTAGEYAFAVDFEGVVNTLYREFEISVGQLVDEFGKENCTPTARRLYEEGNFDAAVRVVHAMEPRRDRDTTKRDGKNMPFKSIYFEPAAEDGKYLRESGFKTFRAICPRWNVTSGDIYGSSPGMEALGDIKQLQHQQLRKAQGIDYQTRPSLQAPTSMKDSMVDGLPGGITFVDAVGQSGGIRPTFESRIDLSHLGLDIADVRQRINSTFYADLFLMLYNADKNGLTATEVAERHEEKLLMLGPVLERVHNEGLDPLIETTFEDMVAANLVPNPPEEMQGMELNVEYVSMLAQAQRAVTTNSVDRFVGTLGSVAAIKPEVLDKFDADRWADSYADALGIDPELIVPSDKVAFIRQQRAQVAAQQEQALMAQQQAETASKLASVDTASQNAFTDATRAFSGYT